MMTPEFSRPVAVDRIGRREKRYSIEANAAERQALAERFGIVAVTSFSADLTLSPLAGGAMIRLSGRFCADVVQACVVTLEPVPAHIEESFHLTYGAGEEEAQTEVVVDLDAEDPAEPIVDGMIDIGEAASEHLALALDPFPRAPGAEFQAVHEVEPPAETQPVRGAFAGLAALVKK